MSSTLNALRYPKIDQIMAKKMRDFLLKREKLEKVKRIQKARRLATILTERQRETLIENIECSICLQVIVYPDTNICGHTFCFECLEQTQFCPLCRAQLVLPEQFLPNIQMMRIIADQVKHKSPEERDYYQSRIFKFSKRLQDRFYPIDKLFQGLRVDFRIRIRQRLQWKQGVIQSIREENGETIVRVFSLYPAVIQQVNVRSMSIARFRLFTLNLPENVYSTVVAERNQDERAWQVLENARLTGSAHLVGMVENNIRAAKSRRAMFNGELF